MTDPDEFAAYFDGWYADMAATPLKDEIEQRHLGLPPQQLSTSLLTWDGLAEVTEALRLGPDAVLLDLACGRGGYGWRWRPGPGPSLVGVDFSAVAVRQARDHADRLGRRADFRVGHLEATGLDGVSVDAVMVVDAVQFADPVQAAYDELARVVRPGGRVVLTCREVVDHDDQSMPERLRRVDLRQGLTRAGFVDVEVEVVERTAWRAAEQAMWTEAAALDPGADPALRSFHHEGVRSLVRHDLLRRVLGTAIAPGRPGGPAQ